MDSIRAIKDFLRRKALLVIVATLTFAVIMVLVNILLFNNLQAYQSYPKDEEFPDLKKIENMEEVCRNQYPAPQYEFIKLDTNSQNVGAVIPAYRVRCIIKDLTKKSSNSSVIQQPSIDKDMNLDCYCEKKPYHLKDNKGETYTRAIFLNYRDPQSWFCIKDNSEKKISSCQ